GVLAGEGACRRRLPDQLDGEGTCCGRSDTQVCTRPVRSDDAHSEERPLLVAPRVSSTGLQERSLPRRRQEDHDRLPRNGLRGCRPGDVVAPRRTAPLQQGVRGRPRRRDLLRRQAVEQDRLKMSPSHPVLLVALATVASVLAGCGAADATKAGKATG